MARKAHRVLTALAALVLSGTMIATAPPAFGEQQTVGYAPSTENFANPERGFYRHRGDCQKDAFVESELRDFRTKEGVSLVMCVFYLAEFKNSPINDNTLLWLQRQFDTVRAAGMKMILRFAYTESTTGDDAPKERVLAHLDQLKTYLRDNSDVIDVMQAGFIGAWGEWYYTKNFGDSGVVSPADWANRKAVTDKLLEVLPATRMIQVRTPKIKRTMYSPDALPDNKAYDGTALARIGHHNDCFLASATDFGTYEDPAVEYPYLQKETKYLAMGGETCALNQPRTDCDTAQSEMSGFHWSYLNKGFNKEVIDKWDGKCLPDITRKLGYRFALQSGTYPATATPGGGLPISVTIRNDGYAAPTNPRGAALILRNTANGQYYWFTLNADPRRWQAGETTTLNQTVTLPANMPAGNYALLLTLPDQQLSGRPEYSVRLANENVWEAATGYNSLLHTVTVG